MEKGYFRYLELDESSEGCFHPDDTFVAELDDYQKLLVYNGVRVLSMSLMIHYVD